VKNRRSLTPSTGMPAGDDVHATRRGGARRDVTARVTLKAPGGETFDGWALNISRGGVRVILEDKVELGSEYEVTVCTAPDPVQPQRGRIVWMQEEPDGVVVGIEFRGESGLHPSSAPPAADGRRSPGDD
jgi:hypothetical protein